MAETSIKISLELADAAAQKALSDFIAKGSSAEKGLDNLKKKGGDTFDQITVGIGKAAGVYEIFEGNLLANLATKAFEEILDAAHALFDTFVVEGVKAASEQENAVNSLNIALSQTGIYSEKTSKEIQDFAAELQRTTGVADDVVLKNAALIQSLARLDSDGLQDATKGALDLSAALGISFEAASEALGKAANGNVTTLNKMGVAIQKGRTDAETFANALQQVEERFGGAAEAKINTFSGAVSLATTSFEDLQKAIGNIIVQNPAVIAVVKEFGTIIEGVTDSVTGQKSALVLLVGEGLSGFLQASAVLITVLDTQVRFWQTLYGVIQTLSVPLLAITVPIRALSVGFAQATKEAEEFVSSGIKNLTAFGQSGDGVLAKTATGLLQMKEAADKGLASLSDGSEKAKVGLDNAAAGVANLTEEQKKAQEARKQFAEDLVKQADASKQQSANEIEQARAKADILIAVNQYELDTKQINQVQFLQAQQAAEADFEKTRIEADQQKYADDQARLEQSLQEKSITENQYYIARDQLAANFSALETKRASDDNKKQLKAKSDLINAERLLDEQRVGYVADTFGNLSSLMRTSSRELFAIGKAAAIAQATINTYQAITKTMATVPYPFNIPLAAAQGIAGFVQVANIASTNPSFEDGGIVPGTSYTGDRVAANVNSGEMILNRSQQAQLFSLANGNGSSSSLENKIDALISYLAGRDETINVNIGGKTVVSTLRSELAAGRTFA